MDYKKLAIIGGATVGAGALLYYLMSGSSKAKTDTEKQKQIHRDVIMKTLSSLKKELFTVCMQMSIMAEQMKQYSGGQLGYDIKEFILSYPIIQQEITSSISKAYNKNQVSEVEFQYNCEVYYASDKEIQTQMKEIKAMVDDSAEGKKIDIKTEIPEFLTQEKLLQIIKQIMIETTKAMQTIFVKIKEQHGELNLNDPRIARQLQSLEADSIKDKVFKQYNLEDLEDNPQKVVSYATQKYSEQPSFQQELMSLELKQRKSMESIMKNPENADIVDKIFDEQSEPMDMGMGMGGQFPGFHSQRKKNQPAKPAETKIPAEEKKEDPEAEIKKTEEKTETKVEETEQKHHEAEKKQEVAEKVEDHQTHHEKEKVEEPVVQQPEEHTAFNQIEQSVEVIKEKVAEEKQEEKHEEVHQESH